MNIINIIKLLSEERGTEYISNTLKGKVPDETIEALQAKMKKGKFDKESMSIFRTIQDAPEDKSKYLASHASMVYSIIKKLKAGSSDFNIDSIMDNYISSALSPQTFWRERYSEANNKPVPMTKEEQKYNTPGLNTARFKDLGDSFAILPKDFKKFVNDVIDIKTIDLKRSHEELRKLSAELANRDTSEDQKAKVNHWCVAADTGSWYNSYKNGEKGVFVIFIKKKEDGKPDWNNRWLAYFKGWDRKDWSLGNGVEIADKFDRHIRTNELPKNAAAFLYKMFDQKKNQNGGKQKPNMEKELTRRIYNTRDEREVISDGTNENARKLLDYIFSVARKAKRYKATQIRSYLRKELRTRGLNNFQEWEIYGGTWFYSAFGGVSAKITHTGGVNEDDYDFSFGPYFQLSGSKKEILAMLDKCVADPSLIEKNIDENMAKSTEGLKKKLSAKEVKYSEPTKNMIRSLGGNEKIMKRYFDKRDDDLKELKIKTINIPSPNSVKNEAMVKIYFGDRIDPNRVRLHYSWGDREIGSKNDPKTLEKLKEALNKIFSK